MPDIRSLIEAVCKPHSNVNDQRVLYEAFMNQLELHNQSTGTAWLNPTSSTQKASTVPPPLASAAAVGANGAYQVNIANPSQAANATIYHEISYSPVKNFSQGVTTLPHSAQTSVVVPTPGTSGFIRFRSSYDKVHWNSYQLVQNTAVDAGLQSSAATEPAVVLNQSNYATVTAEGSVGGAPTIKVFTMPPSLVARKSIRSWSSCGCVPMASCLISDPGSLACWGCWAALRACRKRLRKNRPANPKN